MKPFRATLSKTRRRITPHPSAAFTRYHKNRLLTKTQSGQSKDTTPPKYRFNRGLKPIRRKIARNEQPPMYGRVAESIQKPGG